MKYRIFSLIAMIGLYCMIQISASAQKSAIPWQVATKDSINELVKRFGYAVDLVYLDPVDEKFVKNERRQITEGIELFKTLFRRSDSDTTSIYRKKLMVNFLDTAYIRLFNEFSACSASDKNCRDNALAKLLALNNRRISVLEYLRLQNLLYNDSNLPSDAFTGTSGSISDSVFINTNRIRIAANTYSVDAYIKLFFSGYGNVENQPVLFKLEDLNLRVTVEFDQINSPEGYFFRNYRISEITDFFDPGGTVGRKHVLTIEPSFNYGIMSQEDKFDNHDLEEAFQQGNADSREVGVVVERKMNVFQDGSTKLTIGTGILLRNQLINSSLSDGYFETTARNISDAPFTPSGFLKKYSLESTFLNAASKDNQWFVGIPLRLGVDFGVSRNNTLRGYFKTMFSVYLPVGSSSSVSGSLNQLGKFTYEHVPGFETTIYMGDADNPFPEVYGLSVAYSSDPADMGVGFANRTDLGFSVKMKNNLYLNLGPSFSVGTFQVKDPVKEYLANEGGAVKSPLNALNKLNYLTYGFTLSLSFEMTKPIISKLK